MSLVRLISPGRESLRGDERSSAQCPGSSSSPRFDTDMASAEVISPGVDPTPSAAARQDQPGARNFGEAGFGPNRTELGMASRRPSGQPTTYLPPQATDGTLGDVPLGSAATLPPIDEYDRPKPDSPTPLWANVPRDEESPKSSSDRIGSILLGLSSSAALCVGLYAPDLAAAVRRAVPRPVRNLRPRTGSRRVDGSLE